METDSSSIYSEQAPLQGSVVFMRAILLVAVFFGLVGADACQEDYNLDPKQRTSSTTSTSTSATVRSSTTTSTSGSTTDATTTSTTDSTDGTEEPTPESAIDDSRTLITPTETSAEAFDSDSDGIPDTREQNTDPLNPDSDGDGQLDGAELLFGSSPVNPEKTFQTTELLEPTQAFSRISEMDKDGDGLPDVYEVAIGTDPNLWDSDGDGYSDGIELLNGTPVTAFTSGVIDSDLDGLADEAEPAWAVSEVLADADRDQLVDPLELLLGNDPKHPDTDGDGILDGWDTKSGSFRFPVLPWMMGEE